MTMKRKPIYEFGPFLLDPAQGLLFHNGERVPLHLKTFLILQTLVEANGEVVRKEDLMEKIWPDVVVEENNLTKNISLLRKALANGGDGGELIETIPKIGYRFGRLPRLIEVENGDGKGDVNPDAIRPPEIKTDPDPVPTALPAPDRPERQRWKIPLFVILLCGIAALSFYEMDFRDRGTAEKDRTSSQTHLEGLRFCQRRTTDGFRLGIEALNTVVVREPRNAMAYVSLSICYQLMGESPGNALGNTHQQASAMALKAVEIDETLADAQAQLGFLEMMQWYFSSAERRLKHAVGLNPKLVDAHAKYGVVLLSQGRLEEGLSEFRQCLSLDPHSFQTRTHMARGLYMARRYEEAIAQCREYVRLDPKFTSAQLYLGLSLYHQGNFPEAVSPLEHAVLSSEGRAETKAALAQTLVKLGRTAEAQRLLEYLQVEAARNMSESYYVASVFAAMNRADDAFAWLEKAWQQRHPAFATRFKIDPSLDPLRSDPRYSDLLRRTGLTP
jgi:DNA-binding winged helix-turn-helix (wHTH) protein/Flp pilus assembly protein TadD